MESILRIGLGRGLPMPHKMLIFKRGIDFSSVRRQTLFPTLFPWEEGIPSSKRNQFQLELIPKFGISSWNRFRNSILFKNLGSVVQCRYGVCRDSPWAYRYGSRYCPAAGHRNQGCSAESLIRARIFKDFRNLASIPWNWFHLRNQCQVGIDSKPDPIPTLFRENFSISSCMCMGQCRQSHWGGR